MTILLKALTGTAGLAMVAAVAVPAAAQPYPPYGGGYGNQGSVGQVIGEILGGGRYGEYGRGQHRMAVDQCARAAEARVNGGGYGGFGGYNQGYNQGYGGQGYNRRGNARVVGITKVERRSNGLKVFGVIDSGMGYRGGGYGGYDQGYNQGYGSPGYDYRRADLRFDCKVDYRGYVTDVDINRNIQTYRRDY